MDDFDTLSIEIAVGVVALVAYTYYPVESDVDRWTAVTSALLRV